jgi:hypothetical protein
MPQRHGDAYLQKKGAMPKGMMGLLTVDGTFG